MAQMQVFVSHSHEDDAFCREVVKGLREAGADVWYDEHNMGSGQLIETIERELRVRPVFVLVLSPAALRSQWVRDETTWWSEPLIPDQGGKTTQPKVCGTVMPETAEEKARCAMPGRTFTREFKLEIVRQLANGTKRPAQMCREHQLSDSLLARWRHDYAERGEAAFTPRSGTGADASATPLETRIADLERFCGQLALENAALKKALQQASRTAPIPSGSTTP